MFDRPALWTAIGDGPEAETTKAAVEELAELFGYLLLTFAGVESVAMASADHAAESIDKQNAPTVERQVA